MVALCPELTISGWIYREVFVQRETTCWIRFLSLYMYSFVLHTDVGEYVGPVPVDHVDANLNAFPKSRDHVPERFVVPLPARLQRHLGTQSLWGHSWGLSFPIATDSFCDINKDVKDASTSGMTAL